MEIGKAPPEDLDAATRRLEEWRALRRQQALVIAAEDRASALTTQPAGQVDSQALGRATADLVAISRKCYATASLLMPGASELLAGALARGDMPTGRQAQQVTSPPESQPAATRPVGDLPTREEMLTAQRKPYKVSASQPGQRCNLVWRQFPVGFADYFCIQGTGMPAIPDPKPAFCKSSRPLLFHTPKGTITSAMLLDASGPGGLYDTLYVDFNGNGNFLDDPVYHAQPYEGVAPDGGAVHTYFPDVRVMRAAANKVSTHVQVFLKDATWDTKGQPPYTICMIPQRWAVGTVQLKDQTVPAAVFDRNWNDSAVDQVGLNLAEYMNKYPRGDYLYLDPEGGEYLRPGSLGGEQNGSPHTILNKYLQVGEDTYEIKAAQWEEGVQLDLVPVQLPMGEIRVRMIYPSGQVIGLKTSLLVRGEFGPIRSTPVPADTYAYFGMDNAIGEAVIVDPGQTADLPRSASRPEAEQPRALAVGQAAPPQEVPLLDGRQFRLADCQGKVVLLNFWATWCGPCLKEIPDLAAVWDRFGGGDRFVMISLSLDDDAETLQAFRKAHPMPWPQAFLSDKDRAEIQKQYGVAALPATFLVGPDGKILGTGLRADQAAEVIEKALRPEPASPAISPLPTSSSPASRGINAEQGSDPS